MIRLFLRVYICRRHEEEKQSDAQSAHINASRWYTDFTDGDGLARIDP
jgi:hypothetical protein